MPIDLEFATPRSEHENDDDDSHAAQEPECDGEMIQEWIDSLCALRRQGLENIQVAQTRQVEQHARRNGLNVIVFRVGDLVLKYNAARDTRRGDRMQAPWAGPYEIVRVGENGTYQLRFVDSGRVLQRMVNGSLLRAYRSPRPLPAGSAESRQANGQVEVVVEIPVRGNGS